MIAMNIGTTPESEEFFAHELWRQLKHLDPPEDIYINWADGRAVKLTVENAKAVSDESDRLEQELRAWTHDHDPHVRAAVELLIEHGTWLHRPEFVNACIRGQDGEAWIVWRTAREFVDAGNLKASATEVAVLDFAVALGEDRYKLDRMGDFNATAIVRAVATALAVEVRM